jgi:predicted ATPase
LIDLGLPTRNESSAFNLDPEIKREVVWSGPVMRPASVLVKRKRTLVELRGTSSGDSWENFAGALRPYESVLTEVLDPVRAPELLAVRDQIRNWRFYDQFRTDTDSPARQSQIGTRTPVLDADGRDLAAALQTIIEIGDADALHGTIEDAFPGSRLKVIETRGRFDLELNAHGLLRPLSAAELSDGTLRYLLLVAALLSPRPPSLMVLNEPETSLHADLLSALARLIGSASEHTQIVVVTHARRLVEALTGPGARPLCLVKDFGATTLKGDGDPLEQPLWNWGSR